METHPVIAGLDPGIYPLEKNSSYLMDARVIGEW